MSHFPHTLDITYCVLPFFVSNLRNTLLQLRLVKVLVSYKSKIKSLASSACQGMFLKYNFLHKDNKSNSPARAIFTLHHKLQPGQESDKLSSDLFFSFNK